MSQLVDLYNKSKKPRPLAAKLIPSQEVNVFDQSNTFQNGWKNFQRPGLESTFTQKALNYYDTELSQISIPQSFVPLDADIPLQQYNPKKPYYVPGQQQG